MSISITTTDINDLGDDGLDMSIRAYAHIEEDRATRLCSILKISDAERKILSRITNRCADRNIKEYLQQYKQSVYDISEHRTVVFLIGALVVDRYHFELIYYRYGQDNSDIQKEMSKGITTLMGWAGRDLNNISLIMYQEYIHHFSEAARSMCIRVETIV